jgi:hypothetical protein
MNSTTTADDTTHAELGKQFIRWGFNLSITGFFLGLVPIAHYIHGAVAGDVGHQFMKNMTLWWGCPAVLMELTLKNGGLAMLTVGICYYIFSRESEITYATHKERRAFKFCVSGLIAATIYMAVGYVVCNMIWPNFYFSHNETGKNVWLAGQLVFISVFIYGFWTPVRSIKSNYL